MALEEATGSELFRRLARGYGLTEPGEALLKMAVAIEEQNRPIGHSADAKAGFFVNVSAGSWMTLALCQQIAAILQEESSMQLRFISSE